MDELSPNQTWFENGILYAQYNRPTTADESAKFIDACYDMLHSQQSASVVPMIIIFAPTANLARLNVSQAGRLMNHPLVKHVSTFQLVNVKYAANPQFVNFLSKFFFGKKLQTCNSRAEAEANARQYLDSNSSILEP